MKFLTEDMVLVCNHETGIVNNRPTQSLVTIAGRRILVSDDPEGKAIDGCTNLNVLLGLKPCLTTLKAQAGYSEFVRIQGHPVCLDTLTGFTDGTPPGVVLYKVRRPGQDLVVER